MVTAERTALGRRETLNLLREHRGALAERFGVRRLALFGSTARDEAGPDSDVDVLAAFDRPPGMRAYGGALDYLRGLLGPRVDLIVESELRAEFRPFVEADAIYVLPELPAPQRENRPMPERLWDCYVRDMIEAGEELLALADRLDYDAIVADPIIFKGVLYNVMIIGEAVTHIPAHVHEAHPEIPWSDMVGTRNRVVHGYPTVDATAIREIIGDDIPALLPRLRDLLGK